MSKIKKVACALLIKEGCILIQDRKGISKYGEDWSFFGGGIDHDETPKQALLREMNEELSIDISNWNILEGGELVHSLPDYNIEYHRYLFLINIPDNVTIFQDHEGAGAHFFPISELHTLKFNTDISREIAFLNSSIFI